MTIVANHVTIVANHVTIVANPVTIVTNHVTIVQVQTFFKEYQHEQVTRTDQRDLVHARTDHKKKTWLNT